MRALIIEDAAEARRMLELLLEQRGHEVVAVADAEAGLAAHEQRPFDLMVVDWRLPGMSGLEFCRQVRALPGGEDLAILVVTGLGEPEEVVAVFEAGATDYLRKPIDLTQMNIRMLVAERQVREAQRRREAEARLHTVAANIPGVVYQAVTKPGQKLQCTYLSEGLHELLGLTVEQVRTDPYVLATVAAPSDVLLADLRRMEQHPMPAVLHRRFIRPDGKEVWLQVHMRPTPLPDGSMRWDGVAVDITDQKRAEEALRRSEMTFRTLTENSPEAIVVQRDDHLIYANPMFVELLGYEHMEDIPKESVLALYHPDDRDSVVQARKVIIATGGPSKPIEIRLLRRDGTMVTTEAMGMKVDHDGSEALLAIFRDVTERNEMRAQLMSADRMASVGTLAAGVAHELNNPLAYVLSNIQMLREEVDAASALLWPTRARALRELVDESAEGVERMRAIVRDLKTFSRIDDEDHHEIVHVNHVIDSCLNLCRNEIRHRAHLEKRYGKTPPVQVNEARLGQVVLNLLINAAQAVPEGRASGNQIVVETGTDDDGCAYIQVRDSGVGIARENLDRVFDPFYTTKGLGEGSGLGLSICRNIVTTAGGDVSVQSTLGQGTTFLVTLPAASRERLSRRAVRPTPMPQQPTRRLLVIDDEPLVGRALKRVLRGHPVSLASSGREAIDMLTSSVDGFDLILCDLMMPDVSGMEVYKQVSARRPELAERFVFMTGGAFTPAARQFLDQVANERIEKPFDPGHVRALVQSRTAV